MLEAVKSTDYINQYINHNNSNYNKTFENEESTLSKLNNSNINNDKTVKKEEKSLLDSNTAYYIDLTYGAIIKNFQLVNHIQSKTKHIFQESLVFPYVAMKEIEKLCSYMAKDL